MTIVDETEPLLGLPSDDLARAHTNPPVIHDPRKPSRIVDFDPEGDPENPQAWSRSYRWALTLILTWMAFNVTFCCGSVVPIASGIVRDLDGKDSSRAGSLSGSGGSSSSRYASVLLVTIWELGESAGPLIIAPLSEMFGRYPVLNVCNSLFATMTLLSAFSPTTPILIMCRALSGLVVSSNVLNPALIGDLWEPEDRGSPMSLVQLAPLIGGSIGPALAGAIAEQVGWRWVLVISALLIASAALLTATLFRETYKVAILKRRARRLAASTSEEEEETQPLTAAADREINGRDSSELLESIVRPFYVFGSSGVLMALALYGSVAFSHFYNISTTLPHILETYYALTPKATGGCLVFFSCGAMVSVLACNLFLDRIYVRLRADSASGAGQPEFRLPLSIVGGLIMPPALAFYGWAAQAVVPLPLLMFAVAVVGSGLLLTILPLSAYVVDAFGLYSASAMTGFIVARCLMGTFLPLATTPLVDALGYGWGFTVLAGVSAVLAPVPIVVMRFGEQWRAAGKYTNGSQE